MDEARPVTHTSYRKSCLGCFEIVLGCSSAAGSYQFSALVATKSCVALFWPRSAVSSETQRRKAKPPLAMLADALRACPCVSRGMMKGRGFGARAQHMPRRIFRRGRWCQCCRGCPWEAGLFGAAGSDDVVLIATPTAGDRVLATIRRKSLPKRCL